jgi:hypothetical protein
MMNGSIDGLFWDLRDHITCGRLVEAATLWQEMQSHPGLQEFQTEIYNYGPAPEHVKEFAGHAKALTDSDAFWAAPDIHSRFWSTWYLPF